MAQMKDSKRASTKAKMVTVSVTNVPKNLLETLRADAKNNHRSLSGHVRALIEEAIEKRKEVA
jgi:hypothetical protein